MRKIICIIALLCSIFVSEAQLIIPVGKTFVSHRVAIQELSPITSKLEETQNFPLTQAFTFVKKDSVVVRVDEKIVVTIKIGKEVFNSKDGNIESHFFEIERTFDGKTVNTMMGVFTDQYGRLSALAVGNDIKVSFFIFDIFKPTNS